MPKIIVIEDEADISENIVMLLQNEKHTVDASLDGEDAWEKLQRYDYDLVILDWNLPGMEGLDVLKKYRAQGHKTPVLFLTGRDKISEKLVGLDSGADDYLTKPFDLRELLARVRVLLRRPKEIADVRISHRDVMLDTRQQRCEQGGEEVKLLPREFALLELLIRNLNQVFTPDQLIDKLWKGDDEVSIEAIRQTVSRLRSRLDKPGAPSYITTVVGVGYKIE
jgi:OmpR-family two-component system manganese-sensing response regulator